MSDLPDFFSPFVLKVWDGSQFVTALGLPSGEFYAMLKCKYNSTIKDVLGDQSGNLTLNLKAQDLAEIINRPKYGAANIAAGYATVDPSESKILTTVSGKGVTYGGYWYLNPSIPHNTDFCQVVVDGNLIPAAQFDWWNRLNFTQPGNGVSFLTCYDPDTLYYAMSLIFGITFETSFAMRYFNAQGAAVTVQYRLIYALV